MLRPALKCWRLQLTRAAPLRSFGCRSTLVFAQPVVDALRTTQPRFFSSSVRRLDPKPETGSSAKIAPQTQTAVQAHSLVKADPEPPTHISILKGLIMYMWPAASVKAKVRVVVALLLLVAAKLLNVEVPFFFKDIVDTMNIAPNLELAGTLTAATFILILSYGAARFGATLFGELRNAIFASVAQKAIRQVSRETFEHLINLDHSFHLTHPTGSLTRAMDRGCKGISYVLSAMVFHIAPIILEVGMVGSILCYKFSWSFTVVTLSTICSYAWFTVAVTQWRSKFRRTANKADNIASGIATETLVNFESIKLFCNEKTQLKKYDEALKRYEKSSVKVATSLAFLNSGQNLIFSTALTAMMYMTCQGLACGQMTVGDLILINQLVFQLSVPLSFLGSVYRDMKQALLDMESLFQLRAYERKIVDVPNAEPLRITRGEVEFKNVSFCYRPEVPLLTDVSFKISAGQRIAVVGPSGSGKSTILRLLFRFIEPQSGSILIDGQDIRSVTIESLRKNIGVVPQETPLFNDTIGNNIRFGRLSASDEEVLDAARRAELSDLLNKMPDGLNVNVGERGLMISGGERQRLAIARILLKRAPIVLFDEATSALDTETEQALLENIHKNIRDLGGTALFIAHRLRTVADCDLIIVLRGGRVAEVGSHRALLRDPKGLYSQMWKAQELSEEAEKAEEELDVPPAKDGKDIS